MSVIKLPLLADLQQKVGESVHHFNHRFNVSPIHLQSLFGVGKFTNVVRVCADRHKVVQGCRKFEKQRSRL
jgi:hypothetical protein